MAKFLYVYSNIQDVSWDRFLNACHFTMGKYSVGNIRQSKNEFLYLTNAEGISNDYCSVAAGCPNPLLPPKEQIFFSLRLLVHPTFINLETDPTGSRAIWYACTKHFFIVSTSQRALVAALGSFVFNQQAAAWMISAGCLGNNSWDSRINRLSAGKTLTFKKSSFQYSINEITLPESSSLPLCFEEVFSAFNQNIPYGLTLSGGVDSRISLLQLIRKQIHVKTYSWGVTKENERLYSDVWEAERVAKDFKLPHKFIEIADFTNEAKSRLKTFFEQGEGRVDHIQTLGDDNFWKLIVQDKIHMVVRSDEAFGWLRVQSKLDARISVEMPFPNDMPLIHEFFKNSDLPPPFVSTDMYKAENETIHAYRDRIYRNWRLPNVLSALSETALGYVEIINPLIYPCFIAWAKEAEDNERTNKRAFRQYASSILDNALYAKSSSVPQLESLLKEQAIRQTLEMFMRSDEVLWLLHKNYRDQLLKLPANAEFSVVWKERATQMVPFALKKLIRKLFVPYNIAIERLSLRLYIVHSMNQLLHSDSRIQKESIL